MIQKWLILLTALLTALILSVPAWAEEALPPYTYSGDDPVVAAVTAWMTDSAMADMYRQEEGSVMVPAPVILRTQEGEGRMLVYGNFWTFNYVLEGTVLKNISGGEAPGVMTLEKTENGWKAVSLETAGDGEQYWEDIVRFCDGDTELENLYATSVDQDVLEPCRIRFLQDYVKSNGLNIDSYQDYGWDPVSLADEGASGQQIRGSFEYGVYVLTVSLQPDDTGVWKADDMEQDDSVVRLESEERTQDSYTVRYVPVADGEVTVSLRHFTGIACDELHTFDLLVREGSVQEVTGGSYTASPKDEELDPYLSGNWTEKDTQFTSMTLSKNEGAGWTVEITSPMTHEGTVLRATVQYDCEMNALIYEDGVLTNLTAEGTETAPAAEGLTGRLSITEDEGTYALSWYSEHRADEEDILFVRAE